MNRRRWAWLGVLALVAGAVLVFGPGKPSDGQVQSGTGLSAPRPDPPPREPSPGEPSVTPAPSPNSAAALPRMPAADAPLALSLDTLVTRADAGDPQAACRLAMELLRCEYNQHLMATIGAFFHEQEARLEASGELDAADKMAADELAKIEVARQCRAVPEALRTRAPHYLGQAARAGHPEAMVRYADSQHWPPDGRGVFSDPEFERWRRDAPAMLQRAFAAGVPEAAFVLIDAYQSNHGMVGALIPDDPVKAEALRLLMVRLHGWPARTTMGSMDAASLHQAAELARQWHEGPFQGRRYHGQKRATFQHASSSLPGADAKPFCSDERRLLPGNATD